MQNKYKKLGGGGEVELKLVEGKKTTLST